MSEGRFDLSTFRSERTNEASTLTITPKRSSSQDVGTSSYRYHTATILMYISKALGEGPDPQTSPPMSAPLLIGVVSIEAHQFSPFLNSSSCASASSSNARELDEQILEVKINPQEKNHRVSDTSTNKDTLSKEKESGNENEETKLIRNDFVHYVGTPIDADLREQILKLGPYQPEGNFQKDVKGRSFSSSYYSFISKAGQKIERK
ncbi:hypothetical protein TNCV_4916211 [Trichonephila clavipes]|nr:hypothetical protein TNCV_4916211 [Trichonephila clavipes]